VTTFAEILQSEFRRDSSRPLVTFYDDRTGERTELSVATYANWVAKAASLLVDEHGLERGDVLRLDLPPHWLSTVFLGAAWSAGLVVTLDDGIEPDAVVTGPRGLDRWSPIASEVPVLACALLPLGVRFPDGLPPGVHDVGEQVWSQPDSFIAIDPPASGDPAIAVDGRTIDQEEMWTAAAVGSLLTDGGRVLIAANPASPLGISAFTEPVARGGSVVLVVGAGADRLRRLAADERAVLAPTPDA
jgi:uncharacterized protein (TIGR03089 family)